MLEAMGAPAYSLRCVKHHLLAVSVLLTLALRPNTITSGRTNTQTPLLAEEGTPSGDQFLPVTHLLGNLQKDLRNLLLPINTVGQMLGAPGPCPSLEGPMAVGLPQPLNPLNGGAGRCFLLSAFTIWAGLAPREKQCL